MYALAHFCHATRPFEYFRHSVSVSDGGLTTDGMRVPVRRRATHPPEAGGTTESVPVVPRPRDRVGHGVRHSSATVTNANRKRPQRQYGTNSAVRVTGGPTLAVQSPTAVSTSVPTRGAAARATSGGLLRLMSRNRAVLVDILAIGVASLDVAMAMPDGAVNYTLVLSAISVCALVFRRR